MNTKTKLFIVLLVIGIGGGLVYTQWQKQNKPRIKVNQYLKEKKAIQFEMSYKGAAFSDTIQYGQTWRKEKDGIRFLASSKDGVIYLFIKNAKGAILAQKVVLLF
ncbi:hypothetical protein [Aureispira anguillae]|uniref:Uncharacterized protein n=1 Tax=Aureispira anguillae TaxID=2864201 RepID=A0A915YCI3_9BACT|nr:hypothetical protein [Aureispira anguillae]BDS10568.1 hypothetical protein AsAng_0012760 [Aureispira anguillae]